MSVPRTQRRCVPRKQFAEFLAREIPEEGRFATIAREVGVDESAVRNIWKSPHQWMAFDKADKFLCALGLIHAWHTEPFLAEVWEWMDANPPKRKELRA